MVGGERQADLRVVGGENLAERGGTADGLAEPDEAGLDATIEGRADFRAVEISFRLVEICPCGGDHGVGLLELGDAQDQWRGFLVVADVLPIEFRLFGAGFFLGEGGLGAGQTGFGGGQCGLEVGGIQFGKDIALIEKRAVLEVRVHLMDRAGDQRGNGGAVVGADGSLGFQNHRKIREAQLKALGFELLRRMA